MVGKFVEFFGPGLPNLPLADRATIGNMAPEYGATCGIFSVDAESLRYLEFSGRPKEQVELVEAYCSEQGLFHNTDSEDATYSDTLELDLSTVQPSLAGPRRPQDRVALSDAASDFEAELAELIGDGVEHEPPNGPMGVAESFPASDPPSVPVDGGRPGEPGHRHGVVAERPRTAVEVGDFELDHGAVVIAAITSCTNTSNPSVMIGAGLLAKKAVERGLTRQPWVKTSLAPGSKVVTDYLERAGLIEPLEQLGFAGRVRLHHLHRQLRPAAARDLEGDRGERPGGLLRPLRQPQLRGADPPRGEDELPGEPAAVRGVRAVGADGRGSAHRPAPG